MSARLIPIHADVSIPALSWQQKQNAVQGAINVILQRAQLATTSAELSECRQAISSGTCKSSARRRTDADD